MSTTVLVIGLAAISFILGAVSGIGLFVLVVTSGKP